MPFIMAGDPNIEITSEILLKLQENGADLIELGILIVTHLQMDLLFKWRPLALKVRY